VMLDTTSGTMRIGFAHWQDLYRVGGRIVTQQLLHAFSLT
jgi:hypothetical protein